MAIVGWPEDVKPCEVVTCVVCKQARPISDVMAGLQDDEGVQAFACNGHFWNSARFIRGWADFIADQRDGFVQLIDEIDDEWLSLR